MSNKEWKTKKDKILEHARQDPFLTIEDLSHKADTTPRYVRTILSEANISLMQMRKEYARKIENRYNSMYENILVNYLLNVPFSSKVNIESGGGELVFNNPGDFDNLPGNISSDYNFVSYIHYLLDKPWCINSIVIDDDFDVDTENIRLKAEKVLEFLYNTIKDKDAYISKIKLDIELSTGKVADLLNISSLSPILKIIQTIEFKGDKIIFMFSYFNPEIINISFSTNNGMVIDSKMIG